jgi:hypothetical protein
MASVSGDMPFSAIVLQILIASPSDTADERKLLRQVIFDWTSEHAQDTGVVALPILWETDAVPEMGERPQAILNRQLVERCDVLIGTFWTRLGTPTGEEPSGTVEEVRRFRNDGKPVLLYFSDQPAAPSTVDTAQIEALRHFKAECDREGIALLYTSLEELERLVSRNLNRLIRDRFGVAVPDQARPGAGAQVVAEVVRERRPRTDSRGRLTESTNYFLVLENRGVADAHDVTFRFLPEDIEGFVPGRDPQVMQSGPINHLLAGRNVRFPMTVAMQMRPQLDLEISWRVEGDDQRKSITQTITL